LGEQELSSEEGRSLVQCFVSVPKTTSAAPHLRHLVQALEIALFSNRSVPTH